MIYVYQLAIRKSNDEKKQFVIEHDMITSEKKLDQQFVNETSEKYQCDVKLTYLGELIPPDQTIEYQMEYYTKEQIAEYIQKWQDDQVKEFNDNVN